RGSKAPGRRGHRPVGRRAGITCRYGLGPKSEAPCGDNVATVRLGECDRAFGGSHHMHHRLRKPTLLSVILASTLQGMAFAQQPPVEPAPPPADAEADAAQAPSAKDLDAVTVVGSRLASNRVEGPSPVLVMDEEKIEATGAISGDELLQSIPQVGDMMFNNA